MYKYELHCHTAEGSRCASSTAAEMAEFYYRLGYTGIVITDHFFNGNCTVPKDLPWRERVMLYCRGYENARAYGERVGLDVFFGWEFYGDFVTLGLSPQWLAEHEDLDKLTVFEYFDTIHRDGGYIIHAHPFRESATTKSMRIYPRIVDAMEVINAQNTEFQNSVAACIAEKYGVTAVCGSDAHNTSVSSLCALHLQEKAGNLDALIAAVRANHHSVQLYEVLREGEKIHLERTKAE